MENPNTAPKYRVRPAPAVCLLCAVGLAAYFLGTALLELLAPAPQLYVSGVAGADVASESGSIDAGLLAELEDRLADTPALAPVAAAPQRYPEGLIQLFLANPETLNTLLAYPDWNPAAPAGVALDDLADGFPRLMQWDTRWAYQTYGDGMLAVTGCGPACLSAVAIHLTGDTSLSPAAVARYAEAGGYYLPGTGTTWEMMTTGAARLGLAGEELPLSEARVLAALRAGSPVICSMRQGTFTTGTGHLIVLTAADGDGNITLHDPARTANAARTWRYDELAGEIKNLWAFTAP